MFALGSQHRALPTARWPLAAGTSLLASVLLVRLSGGALPAPNSPGLTAVAVAIGLVPAVVAAAVDASTGRIPDRLVLAASVPAVFVAMAAATTGDVAVLGSIIGGSAVFAGPLLVAHLISPSAIGFGDVKLAAALGALLGLVDPRLGVLALCVGCGTTALIGLAGRRSALPLGPGLALGAVAALAPSVVLEGAVIAWR